MELKFEGPFTHPDLEVVRSIPARRWHPDRLVWVLPRTPEALDILRCRFGNRLAVTEVPGVDGVGPGEDAHRAPTTSPSPGAPHPAVHDILAAMRRVIRMRGYSLKTERAYLGWARRFLTFHAGNEERPDRLEASHARAFLHHLATDRRLAAGSRNQAASALGFMFREVLGRDELADVPRAKGPERMPPVLTHREVLLVLGELAGKYFLVAVLLYSAGLRLEECLCIRVKDIDFELRQILVRDGKGRKDRYVPLARRAIDLLRAQLGRVAELHEEDRAAGHGWAPLPGALHRKDPRAGYELGWQFVFPATTINTDPATGRTGRRALHPTAVQRQVKQAVCRSGITKRATCHTLRHSFAAEALRGGCDIRTLQYVMGHKDVRTTMTYLHVVEQTGFHIRSPLDRPDDPEHRDEETVGRPLARPDIQWDLAARQWDRARTRNHVPAPTTERRRPHRPDGRD